MKLAESGIHIDESGSILSHTFSIDENDQGIIFDILRSKIYSDPIKSICREIISNSRDANREVGKNKTPVVVEIREGSISNDSTTRIVFKDNGPGISPDRMENVFCKYAASTKRDSNKYTGGYGLGAKTPFSYTDCFNVSTVYDGIKYEYVAYIDESKRGKITLLHSEKTEDTSGTSILIPILNSNDVSKFEKSITTSVTFWDVKPILLNFKNSSIPKYTEIYSDNECLVISTPEYNFMSSHSNNNSVFVIIDGIPYEIDTNIIKRDRNRESSYISKYAYVILRFKIGKLDITANRESLHYTENTKDNILNSIKKVYDILSTELITKYTSKIQDYVEACSFLYNLKTNNYNYISDNTTYVSESGLTAIDLDNAKYIMRSIEILVSYLNDIQIFAPFSQGILPWKVAPVSKFEFKTLSVRAYSLDKFNNLQSFSSIKIDDLIKYFTFTKKRIFYLPDGKSLKRESILKILDTNSDGFILIQFLKPVILKKNLRSHRHYTDKDIEDFNKKTLTNFELERKKDLELLSMILYKLEDFSKIEITNKKTTYVASSIVIKYLSPWIGHQSYPDRKTADDLIRKVCILDKDGKLNHENSDISTTRNFKNGYLIRYYSKVTTFRPTSIELLFDYLLSSFIKDKMLIYVEERHRKKFKDFSNYEEIQDDVLSVYELCVKLTYSLKISLITNKLISDKLKPFKTFLDHGIVFKTTITDRYYLGNLISILDSLIDYIHNTHIKHVDKSKAYSVLKDINQLFEKYSVVIYLQERIDRKENLFTSVSKSRITEDKINDCIDLIIKQLKINDDESKTKKIETCETTVEIKNETNR